MGYEYKERLLEVGIMQIMRLDNEEVKILLFRKASMWEPAPQSSISWWEGEFARKFLLKIGMQRK